MKCDVVTIDNKKAGSLDLNDGVFGAPIRRDILARMVNWQRAKRRAGTHKTKSVSEISGTGAKPFQQKGTGRARQGSTRSVQMRASACRSSAESCWWRWVLKSTMARCGSQPDFATASVVRSPTVTTHWLSRSDTGTVLRTGPSGCESSADMAGSMRYITARAGRSAPECEFPSPLPAPTFRGRALR